MDEIAFRTAGESHGPALISLIEGVPAGLPLLAAHVDTELARRQQGYGRGRRMQIEQDRAEFLSGVRAGETLALAVGTSDADGAATWASVRDVDLDGLSARIALRPVSA